MIKNNVAEDATVFGISPAMFTACSAIALLYDALDGLDGPVRDDALEAAVDVIAQATPEGEAAKFLVSRLRRAN